MIKQIQLFKAGTFTALALALVISGCSKDEETPPAVAAPTANFSISGGNCDAPCSVTFSNTSLNAVSYSWDFGDGTPTSTETSPVHIYNSGGTFNVSLIATNSAGATNLINKTVAINTPTVQTKTQKLCDNGSWKLTACGSNTPWNWPNGSPTNGQLDWFQFFVNTCEKDNTVSFNANTGVTDISEGNNSANPNGQPCNTLNPSGIPPIWYHLVGQDGGDPDWRFTQNETKLEFGDNQFVWNIETLSATQLKLNVTENIDGTNVLISITFGH